MFLIIVKGKKKPFDIGTIHHALMLPSDEGGKKKRNIHAEVKKLHLLVLSRGIQ